MPTPPTPPAFTTLVSSTPIRHPEDVARLRAVLNDRGYDASDLDIEQTYAMWCERVKGVPWLGLGCYTDGELLLIMLRGMCEVRGEPGPGCVGRDPGDDS